MKLHPSLSDDLADWAQRQPVFFTGSAATHGPHINVSPKGLADSHFAVLGPNQCAYIDRTGSGCETISHSYENGRLCLMFMSFGNTPRIMRLFCRSSIVEWDQPGFSDLVRSIARGKREAFDGARAVIICDIWQVQTSCGYGVPRVKKELYSPFQGRDEEKQQQQEARRPLEEVIWEGRDPNRKLDELAVFEERPTLDAWAGGRVEESKVQAYHNQNNVESLDGLPGLKAARRNVGQRIWLTDARARLGRLAAEWDAVAFGFLLAVGMYLLCIMVAVRT